MRAMCERNRVGHVTHLQTVSKVGDVGNPSHAGPHVLCTMGSKIKEKHSRREDSDRAISQRNHRCSAPQLIIINVEAEVTGKEFAVHLDLHDSIREFEGMMIPDELRFELTFEIALKSTVEKKGAGAGKMRGSNEHIYIAERAERRIAICAQRDGGPLEDNHWDPCLLE